MNEMNFRESMKIQTFKCRLVYADNFYNKIDQNDVPINQPTNIKFTVILKGQLSTALERNAMHETWALTTPPRSRRGRGCFRWCQKVTQARVLQHWFHNCCQGFTHTIVERAHARAYLLYLWSRRLSTWSSPNENARKFLSVGIDSSTPSLLRQ